MACRWWLLRRLPPTRGREMVPPRTRRSWLVVAIVNTVAALYNITMIAIGQGWWPTNMLLGFSVTVAVFFWAIWWKHRPRNRTDGAPAADTGA
jgi:hypothetical protein